MPNKKLFQNKARHVPMATTTNAAGGKAYELTAHQALAQFATTGTFNDTFYVGAEQQLTQLSNILPKCEPEFIAKTAVYAREVGHMKDMPAFLVAYLFVLSKGSHKVSIKVREFAKLAFRKVINNGRMVRNFVMFMRSGAFNKPGGELNVSLGSSASKEVCAWLNSASDKAIINGSVGNDPSLADVIKLARPKGRDAVRNALFAWVLGKEGKEKDYPALLRQLLAFRKGDSTEAPEVDFRLIVDGQVSKETWKKIANNATWQMARMNLNTFQRHGVFESAAGINRIKTLLSDPEEIQKAKVFPYQLLAAYVNVEDSLPAELKEALQVALDNSLVNVPVIEGNVVVCPDVSGSMKSAITGSRGTATSKVRCVDVAALVAAAIIKKNPHAKVIPFEGQVVKATINPRDSVMTIARQLASLGGGSTACSAPLKKLNDDNAKVDLVVFVSDNESWLDRSYRGGTSMAEQWEILKRKNPKARLILNDITPSGNSQVTPSKDTLLIGGFSDEVFRIIPEFLSGEYGADAWVTRINQVQL